MLMPVCRGSSGDVRVLFNMQARVVVRKEDNKSEGQRPP
jgi:hypothetical protein